MRLRVLLAVLVVLAAASLPAAADVVHLEGGRQLVGHVVDDGDPVRLKMDGGVLSLPRSRIARIERSELPSEVFARRIGELGAGDLVGALALSEEARAAGLPDLAGRVLEAAAEWAPEDPALREALWRWRVYDRKLPPDPEAAERLRLALGEHAHVFRSAHWRIAYDVTTETAQARAAALEHAWKAFHDLMLDLDVRPTAIDTRLEAMLFRNHADWVRATGAPAEALAGLNGIYVGATGRILLFDPATSPEAASAHDQVAEAVAKLAEKTVLLDQQEDELRKVRVDVETYRPTPGDREGTRLRKNKLVEIDDLLEQLAEQRRTMTNEANEVEMFRDRVRRFWSEETVSATMHEACHQIAFATDVARGEHALWLNEGLATLFEAVSREALDPTSKASTRVRDLRTLRDAGQGGDLRRLVSGAMFTNRSSSEAYAEAWSLTAFLILRHPEGVARMLRSRPSADAATDDASRHLDAFRDAFGDLDVIEREWQRFVDSL